MPPASSIRGVLVRGLAFSEFLKEEFPFSTLVEKYKTLISQYVKMVFRKVYVSPKIRKYVFIDFSILFQKFYNYN